MRLKVMSREETCQRISFGMMYGTLSWSCCLWKNRTWSLNGAAARFPPPQPPQATSVACRRAAAWGEEEEWGASCRLGDRKRSGSRTTMLPPRRCRFGPGPGAAAAAAASSGLGFGSEETEWEREPMGQRESPRVSVI